MRHTKPCKLLILGLLMFMNHNIGFGSESYIDYKITSGDSLWKLCQKFEQEPSTCWGTLARLNNISEPSSLTLDRIIIIPEDWIAETVTVAQILNIRGDIQLHQFDETLKEYLDPVSLKKDAKLHQQDKISTSELSSALIIFNDKSEILLKENSVLILKTLSYNSRTEKNEIEVNLLKGRIRSLVNPNKKRTDFGVTTPYAVAAVRGTEFRVSSNDKTSNSEVLKGLVEVNAQNESTSLTKGFASIVEKGKPPSKPIKLLDPPVIKSTEVKTPDNTYFASWKKIQNAKAYEVDLLKIMGDKNLLTDSTRIMENQYITHKLSAGNYRLILKGIDSNELYGLEMSVDF